MIPANMSERGRMVPRMIRIGIATAVTLAAVLAGCGGPTTTSTSSYGGAATSTKPPTEDDVVRAHASDPVQQDRTTYHALAPRDFALLVRDPDSHVGEKVVIYGKISQFDAATGKNEFRGDTGPLAPGEGDAYSQNTYLVAPVAGTVANVVEKDQLRMFAEVMGSYTYDTTTNGHIYGPEVRCLHGGQPDHQW
jgi:hypothetical protein